MCIEDDPLSLFSGTQNMRVAVRNPLDPLLCCSSKRFEEDALTFEENGVVRNLRLEEDWREGNEVKRGTLHNNGAKGKME